MADSTSWHSLSISQALDALGSRLEGLSAAEATERFGRFGANVIPESPPKKLLTVYLDQFKNAFIYLLLIAAAVSLLVQEYGDAIFIAVALQLNAIIGTVQEWQAQEKALGLKQLVKSMVPVLRDGNWERLDSHELVPGDVVEIESGTSVPALLRLLSSEGLEVDESLLTGESLPIVKDAASVLDAVTAMADRQNLLHAGTTVLRGHATALVAETGLRTEVGRVAETLKTLADVPPPLIIRMQKFTHVIASLMVVVIGLIAVGELLRGTEPVAILMTSVALAVAAIPEGLPVALTVALAISVSRMAKRDVVVRKMAAVEGLGACTLIAADKTGTLTVNELTVQQVCPAGETAQDVSSRATGANLADFNDPLTRLVVTGLLCNEARLERQEDGSDEVFGDTVDGAFLKLGSQLGLEREHLERQLPRRDRIPYEPALAYAASFHAGPDGELQAWVKGAAEIILPFCSIEKQEDVLSQVSDLAAQGYRVIALAQGQVDGTTADDLSSLHYIGLVGLIDPLRPSARVTIGRCRDAGVAVRMITGDHPLTALEIGRQLDMATTEADVLTGAQLEQLAPDQAAFDDAVADTCLFARTAPLQKLAIVQSLQRNGHTVAVTGDGVNDVSALAAADIGAAMGKSGTDIARSVADLILVEDELSSLADGIEEGRIAYDNIRKVIYLLISTGAAELVLFLAAIITGLPLPLTPVQLLWLNLVTQGIQDVALAFEQGEPGVIRRQPRPPGEGIFNRQMIEQTLISGLLVGGIAFLFFQYAMNAGVSHFAASNQLLLLLIVFENLHVFNCRSETRSAFTVPIRNNPFLVGGVVLVQLIHLAAMNIPAISTVLDIQPLPPSAYLSSFLTALSIILAMEVYKIVVRRRDN